MANTEVGKAFPSSPSEGSIIKPTKGRWQSAISYFGTEIETTHADLPLLACCLVAGLCDSSAYNAWSCFVSMQTGNSIFLVLGASDQPRSEPNEWLKSLVSILSFLLGCFTFATAQRINPRSRGRLASSFVVQSLFIIIAATLVQVGDAPLSDGIVTKGGSKVNLYELLPLGFLAFQFGGQIVISRVLGFVEMPTTVLTLVYCDIVSDPKILAKDNVKRNRRVGAVVFLLIGGISGGWISKSKAGMSTCLWISAGIKMFIALSWSLCRPKSVIPISLELELGPTYSSDVQFKLTTMNGADTPSTLWCSNPSTFTGPSQSVSVDNVELRLDGGKVGDGSAFSSPTVHQLALIMLMRVTSLSWIPVVRVYYAKAVGQLSPGLLRHVLLSPDHSTCETGIVDCDFAAAFLADRAEGGEDFEGFGFEAR
ncbi:hypothetical protein WAI453_001791 [Rhynchosporium graminicola]